MVGVGEKPPTSHCLLNVGHHSDSFTKDPKWRSSKDFLAKRVRPHDLPHGINYSLPHSKLSSMK